MSIGERFLFFCFFFVVFFFFFRKVKRIKLIWLFKKNLQNYFHIHCLKSSSRLERLRSLNLKVSRKSKVTVLRFNEV